MVAETRVALLIDAENASAKTVEFVLSEVARHGVAHVRRAYGNWKDPSLHPWEERLHELAIRPIQQFSYTSKKNASDMAMTIDAMDLMYAGNIDSFALMSSDADFTPLVLRLLTNGKKVYGYGERKTPSAFVNACSQFTYVDSAPTVSDPADASSRRRWSSRELRGETRLVNLLRLAVTASQDEDGWANLAAVGSQVGNQASFDPQNYGYKKFGEVIKATELFESRQHNNVVQVRDRRQRPEQAHQA